VWEPIQGYKMINHRHYTDLGLIVVSIVHQEKAIEVQVVTEEDTITTPSTVYRLTSQATVEDLEEFMFDLIDLGRNIKTSEVKEVLQWN